MTNDKLADEIEIYLKRHDKVGPGLGAMHWLEKARDALRAERPQSGEMVLWAWGPNGMVRAGEGSCGYVWYAAETETKEKS